MRFKLGICQFRPEFLAVEANLQKMEEILSPQEADLIVLPELATSGYLFNSRREVEKVSEDAFKGITAQLFKKLAKRNQTSYVVGIAEKAQGKFYNSSIMIKPDGQIDLYRKTHLFYEEKLWFSPGNSGFPVYQLNNGVKVGLMICFDWIFPESARTLALKGAQIIAHSANLVLPWCQQAMITRSLENRVFSATSNRTGIEKNGDKKLHFTGMSQILDPQGNIFKRMNKKEESVFIVEIDPQLALDKNVTEYNHIFQDRRKEFYEEI